MSDVCGACGKAFVADEEFPGLYERACTCDTCRKCQKDYKDQDENGPQIAPYDEESHMDGWCLPCMNAERKRVAETATAPTPTPPTAVKERRVTNPKTGTVWIFPKDAAQYVRVVRAAQRRGVRNGLPACEHGHFECALWAGGPCENEIDAVLSAKQTRDRGLAT